MFSAGEGKKWTRRKAGLVSLQKVASLVRDLREPCLSQSRIQVVLTVRSLLSLSSSSFYLNFTQM